MGTCQHEPLQGHHHRAPLRLGPLQPEPQLLEGDAQAELHAGELPIPTPAGSRSAPPACNVAMPVVPDTWVERDDEDTMSWPRSRTFRRREPARGLGSLVRETPP